MSSALMPASSFRPTPTFSKAAAVETWHSRFVYHGFQYVEVTGFPGKPTLDNLRGVFIHSAVPAAGEFECSNPLLNQIWRAGRWSYLSNLQGIPTDCPHREKNGWTGDAHLAAEQGLSTSPPPPSIPNGSTTWATNSARPASCPASCPPAAGATNGATAPPGTAPSCSSPLPLPILRRHAGLPRPLRRHETLRGLPHQQSEGRHRGHRPQRLGALQDQNPGRHYLHRLLLPRRADCGAGRRPARQ